MINKVEIANFGPLRQVRWPRLGQINVVLGTNGSGKTFLLKSLYCAMRTLEEFKRGDDNRSAAEILADKLRWTFQPEKIGDLVTRDGDGHLAFQAEFDENVFQYSFGKDTAKQISTIENQVPPRSSNSVFLPAKEVLSIHGIILKSREEDQVFGFDDTYLDLARALRQARMKGKNFYEFADAREALEKMLGGKVEYDEDAGKWQFRTGPKRSQQFPMGLTAEGVKKIAILDTLLGNRYLDLQSIIFIDEPESALHPTAISRLMEIAHHLGTRGVQFFMATHSYFVVKKLHLIAQESGVSIPVLQERDGAWHADDLKEGMPDNPIIAESIRLYEAEIGRALR